MTQPQLPHNFDAPRLQLFAAASSPRCVATARILPDASCTLQKGRADAWSRLHLPMMSIAPESWLRYPTKHQHTARTHSTTKLQVGWHAKRKQTVTGALVLSIETFTGCSWDVKLPLKHSMDTAARSSQCVDRVLESAVSSVSSEVTRFEM